MRIQGLLNDDERKDVKEFIRDILVEKGMDFLESGFFGVKSGEAIGDRIYFDVYRVIGTVSVSKEEAEKMKKIN